MRFLRHPATHWLLALVLGGVFIYASLEKIAHPREFARIVYHYGLLGPGPRAGFLPANLLAVTLPWIEVVTGALLVLGLWRREAAVVSALMLLAFVVAVAWALAHGIDVENCGCFTVSGEGRRAGLGLIAGDLALLASALILAFVPSRSAAPETASAPEPAASR